MSREPCPQCRFFTVCSALPWDEFVVTYLLVDVVNDLSFGAAQFYTPEGQKKPMYRKSAYLRRAMNEIVNNQIPPGCPKHEPISITELKSENDSSTDAYKLSFHFLVGSAEESKPYSLVLRWPYEDIVMLSGMLQG